MYDYKAYFSAERTACQILVVLGLISVGLAIFFYFIQKTPFYQGLAFPLGIIGLIEIALGTALVLRAPKDIERMESFTMFEKGRIQSEELPRMEKVMANFKVAKLVEMLLTFLGFCVFLFAGDPMLRGLGLGLFIHADLLLVFDQIAERRGKSYVDYLKTIIA